MHIHMAPRGDHRRRDDTTTSVQPFNKDFERLLTVLA